MPSTSHDELIRTLIHDLRQPLGTLETGVFCLHLMIPSPSDRVHEQMQAMERQIAHAVGLLQRASNDLKALTSQDAADGAAASFERTNSATAGVA